MNLPERISEMAYELCQETGMAVSPAVPILLPESNWK